MDEAHKRHLLKQGRISVAVLVKPDHIRMDTPLFIRLLEFAREDAKDDLILHHIAERAAEVHGKGTTCLTMKDYKKLVSNGR